MSRVSICDSTTENFGGNPCKMMYGLVTVEDFSVDVILQEQIVFRF